MRASSGLRGSADTRGSASSHHHWGHHHDPPDTAGRHDTIRSDTHNSEEWSVLYAVRAMPQIEGLMYSALSCPTATINADESIWTALLDRTVVVAGE
jgi:hypothetical protein